MLPLGVQQFVPGVVTLKGHLCPPSPFKVTTPVTSCCTPKGKILHLFSMCICPVWHFILLLMIWCFQCPRLLGCAPHKLRSASVRVTYNLDFGMQHTPTINPNLFKRTTYKFPAVFHLNKSLTF